MVILTLLDLIGIVGGFCHVIFACVVLKGCGLSRSLPLSASQHGFLLPVQGVPATSIATALSASGMLKR